jgi:outer membrane lipoprotein-sorting protein
VDFFKKGKLLKYLENFKIKKVKGILTPFKIVVTQGNKKGSTTMELKKVKYNVKIRNSKFSNVGLR